jgi:hypothetical protein
VGRDDGSITPSGRYAVQWGGAPSGKVLLDPPHLKFPAKCIGVGKPDASRIWMTAQVEGELTLIGIGFVVGGKRGHGFERGWMELGQPVEQRINDPHFGAAGVFRGVK